MWHDCVCLFCYARKNQIQNTMSTSFSLFRTASFVYVAIVSFVCFIFIELLSIKQWPIAIKLIFSPSIVWIYVNTPCVPSLCREKTFRSIFWNGSTWRILYLFTVLYEARLRTCSVQQHICMCVILVYSQIYSEQQKRHKYTHIVSQFTKQI